MARPADHPGFFRLPAPEGRSRESGISVDRLGRFWHEGRLVSHPGMARAFASWIDRHPDDGRYILSNGYDWSYLGVEDAPLAVVSVVDRGAGLEAHLSDGQTEALSEPLWLGADGALYTLVRNSSLEARFQPAAQAQLAAWLEQDKQGFFLSCCGKQLRISAQKRS
jgi:hypothetical protein